MYNTSMAIGIFGGSFDPVHSQHVRYAEEAIKYLKLSKLYILPSYIAPHKRGGAHADADARFHLAEIAFAHIPEVEVSGYEISAGGTSYSYLTCRHFRELYPDEKIYFLVGADMLENFFTWRNPDELLSYCTLAACGRGNENAERLKEKFFNRFGQNFVAVPFTGEQVSSTKIRVDIAFEKDAGLPPAVETAVKMYGLYAYPCIPKALELEKEERREHSYRVALMAATRARSVGVSEEKALLAAALHDCAKYLAEDSPLLEGFSCLQDVPKPVWHQYAGAYVAEHEFAITDGEILSAIRYHTSGKEDMSTLEKLIFLADMLEPSRDFPHVEELRALFWQNLDDCLFAALAYQVEYLKRTGKPVYALTERAYQFIKEKREI